MTTIIRLAELNAFLDEALPSEEMSRIEKALRNDPALSAQLSEAIARRDSSGDSIASLWRTHRLSCPTREELGSYLLGVLPDDQARYFRFHLEVIGCRCCQANLDDLKEQQAASDGASTVSRRKRFFHSSAGYLRPTK